MLFQYGKTRNLNLIGSDTMSMLGSIIKTFLKSEIDSNVKKYISVLSGELDHKDLKLDLNVKLSDIEVKFTGTGLLANKEEKVNTEHVNTYTYTENTGDGNHRSVLNNPDHFTLNLNLQGDNTLNGLKFSREFMGMGVKILSVSYKFDIRGKAEF